MYITRDRTIVHIIARSEKDDDVDARKECPKKKGHPIGKCEDECRSQIPGRVVDFLICMCLREGLPPSAGDF